MRMLLPLATLAQLLADAEGLDPAELGAGLGLAPATVTAVETSGDNVVLHIEGADAALADADGWVSAEWTVDARGKAQFGGFKPVEGRSLEAPAPAATPAPPATGDQGTGDADHGTAPAQPTRKGR